MRHNLLALLEKVLEFLFIGFWVLTLPLWFPLLALYVLLDPPHWMGVWTNRLHAPKPVKRTVKVPVSLPQIRQPAKVATPRFLSTGQLSAASQRLLALPALTTAWYCLLPYNVVDLI